MTSSKVISTHAINIGSRDKNVICILKVGTYQIYVILYRAKCILYFSITGPDHVQVFWKHKSIGNQTSDWLTR